MNIWLFGIAPQVTEAVLTISQTFSSVFHISSFLLSFTF